MNRTVRLLESFEQQLVVTRVLETDRLGLPQDIAWWIAPGYSNRDGLAIAQ